MINIWYPENAEKGIRVGHSSILLDGLDTPRYISYWPKGAGEKSMTYRGDVKEEKGSPDVMISLNLLDEKKIIDWWDRFFMSNNNKDKQGYNIKYNNCSDIVATALVIGGASDHVPAPQNKVWTPAGLESWCIALKGKDSSSTSGIFRHEGISNFLDNAARRAISGIGEEIIFHYK
jgi:hypothetical protein